jgi:hypothetical protein
LSWLIIASIRPESIIEVFMDSSFLSSQNRLYRSSLVGNAVFSHSYSNIRNTVQRDENPSKSSSVP